ncbi:hypothetical protein [Brevibacillus sp. NRS-1366]|uniref:hypothetical protein n=1 Tax=Brevibacillus sp. NRS-1366 TaxID=3233899 RepID=UPI003D1A2571
MIKKMVSYFIGLLILSFLLGGAISFALDYVPYLILFILSISPIYGAFRIQRNWSKGMFSLFKVFRLRKVSLTLLLIGSIVILMVYKVILITLAVSLLISLGGASVIYLLWESNRFILKRWKSIQIVSFFQAFKSAW